jgi:hypothetical protein
MSAPGKVRGKPCFIPLPTFTGYIFNFDISASKEDNILKFSAVKIINYFLPKAFVGTVYGGRIRYTSLDEAFLYTVSYGI